MDGMGHNLGPAHEQIGDRVELLIGNTNRWLAERPEVETEDQARALKDFLDQINAELKAAKEEHKKEKAPHLAAGKAVDDKWRPLTTQLETAKAAMKAKQTAWLIKQEEIRKAEERKAEGEALRKIQEAEEAAKEPATVEDMVAAEAKERAAQEAINKADKIAASRAQVKGRYGGRASSLRTHRVAVITDQDALYRHFRDHLDLQDCLQKLANAEARKGNEVPGMKIEEKRTAA